MSNMASLELSNGCASLEMETNYPYEESINIKASQGIYSLCLRIPEWSREQWNVKVNGKDIQAIVENGYAVIKRQWNEGDMLQLALDMRVKRIYANPRVSKDVGKVAIQRGPLVYCLESIDNGSGLQQVYLPSDARFDVINRPDKLEGITEIKADGLRIKDAGEDCLYFYNTSFEYEKVPLTFIPYYSWANRGENEMTVWVHEKSCSI